MPLYTIKTKPFLKAKPLILLNQGYASTVLDQECQNLNKIGFNASYLQGGLNAWQTQKGPIQGDPLAMKQITLVSPQTVHLEKDTPTHTIINISKNPGPPGTSIFPEAIHIPELTTTEDPMKFIKQIKSVKPAFLIYNQDGKGYDRLIKKFSNQGIGPVFFLEGGLSGYEEFISHLTLSRAPKTARTKSMNCNTCGDGATEDKE